MKKTSIRLITIILLAGLGTQESIQAKGGGKTFGASLGGSLVGSYIGSSVANASNNNSSAAAPVDNNAAYRNLDLENDRLNKKLKKAYDMIDSLEEQVQALKKKNDAVTEQLRMAQKDVKNLQADITTLQQQLKKQSQSMPNNAVQKNSAPLKNKKSLMQRVEADVDQDVREFEEVF